MRYKGNTYIQMYIVKTGDRVRKEFAETESHAQPGTAPMENTQQMLRIHDPCLQIEFSDWIKGGGGIPVTDMIESGVIFKWT